MNTRHRTRLQTSETAQEPESLTLPSEENQCRIVVVETTSQRQVELCNCCASKIEELQHENAVFSLTSDFDSKDGTEFTISQSPVRKKRQRMSHNLKMVNSLKKTRGSANVEHLPDDTKAKVVFPESEYDVLEKRLINLENDLQSAQDNEQFRKLCKMGVMCEERWARMYCDDYNKDFIEYRSEAINVLKQNLNIRRDGLRPFMRLMSTRNQIQDLGFGYKASKKDLLASSPAVNIVSGRIPPPKDYMRGSMKRTYGTCIAISTLTTGPIHNYSFFPHDHCYLIENELFDVESRLKRCAVGSKEHRDLVEEGKRLRQEWRQAVDDMRRSKSQIQPGYDLKKCVVINRGGKKVAISVEEAEDEIAPQMIDADEQVDVQD